MHRWVSAKQEPAQKSSPGYHIITIEATYLAVNSSKVSSPWLASERRLVVVLKLLMDPEVAIMAGTT
jgi:uncharacterized protein YfaS (alpha-2-macroglobulin family)